MGTTFQRRFDYPRLVAAGLHALYRGTAKAESDGSHEKAFTDALALVRKARKP